MADAVEIARIRELVRTGRAREIREGAHVSRAEVAADLGVHETTIQKWEAGLREPSGRLALRFGRLLRELGEVVPS